MNTDLGYWQERLSRHFTALRQQKNSDQPLFALEHGLDLSEIPELEHAVRAHVKRHPPLKVHALPWIVYAVEIGYHYVGDEYWQTFERETPGWADHGNRYWLRERFFSFRKDYSGAVPSGVWAEHFSIICWPITHAILPRDLQRHLARTLYELRDWFSGDIFKSPSELGKLIAAQSWDASSRFQNFAQNALLAGQIASALLLQGELGTRSLIHQATLKRIGEDLDRERRAREWLRGARTSARERLRVSGLTVNPGSAQPNLRRPEEARVELAALGIEPRLILRPTEVSRTTWEVILEIPDLSNLLLKFPDARETLTGSRCVVAGSSGRPLARGRLLHGAQRIPITRWPLADEVLLHFELSNPQLDFLLSTECLLRPGSTRLFRIATDGIAYELRSLHVRPGERYIVLGERGTLEWSDHASPIRIECDGVSGAILELPPALTAGWEATLEHLGIGHAKSIEVWPAGLAAHLWDGEGHGEWLATEQPCLAVCVDHPIRLLDVFLDTGGGLSIDFTSVSPGEPVFVELPSLPIGLHTVRFSIPNYTTGRMEFLGHLDVVIRICEARPWLPGVSRNGPLLVQLDPPAPTMEELWEGRVEVSLLGPVGRHVKCKLSLFDREAGTVILSDQLPPIELPATPDRWRDHFSKYLQGKKRVQEKYDSAHAIELEFSAEELGTFTFRGEREFTPLRWVLRRISQGHEMQLLDDSGASTPRTITRIAFETPMVEEVLDQSLVYRLTDSGGMYIARLSDFTTAFIAPPCVKTLSDLRCTPHIDMLQRSVESVIWSLDVAHSWGQARLAGDLFSASRQRDVLLALTFHIARLVCGEKWVHAEKDSAEHGLTRLPMAVAKRPEEADIGIVISRYYTDLATKGLEERINFIAGLAARYLLFRTKPSVSGDTKWLSELALRLASDPTKVATWAGHRLRPDVQRLMDELPTLARAARCLVIMTDRHCQSRASAGELYAGWRWT